MTSKLNLPTRIEFGWGVTNMVGQEASRLGHRALIVTGRTAMKNTGTLDRVRQLLSVAGVESVLFAEVEPEPSWTIVEKAVCRARQFDVDLVIGLGGGSALDIGKLVACLKPRSWTSYNPSQVLTLATRGIPYIAVPTTAGSGSEVTFYGVLREPDRQAKRGLRGPGLFPNVALVDPALTMSMPRELTLHTGLDALTHAIEAYVSRRSTSLSDIFCRPAIRLIGRSLPAAMDDACAPVPRQEMMLASLLAGIAVANSGLGVAHSLAHALGPSTALPHGKACALLLPWAMYYNIGRQYEGWEQVVRKYAEVGSLLGMELNGLSPFDAAQATVHFIREFIAGLGIEGGLRHHGITEEDLSRLVAVSSRGSRSSNPRPCSSQAMVDLMRMAM